MTTPIVIDCDPGHDDAFAIMLALASPEVELRAITTVAGNQTLDKTTRNALKVLELVDRTDIPVCAGADRPLTRELRTAANVHGESGLDGPELPEPTTKPVDADVTDFLSDMLEPGVVLVPTGPLTNVARLLQTHPSATDRIVWMGGAYAEGNVTPAAEFNAFVDPEAAAAVFASGIDTTMIGLDVTHGALVTDADADDLRSTGRVGRAAAELLDFYRRWHRASYPDLDGSPLHDPVCVAHLIDPTLVETKPAHIDVDCGWEQGRGRTNVDWRGNRPNGKPANAIAGLGIDNPRFVELVKSRIASLD